MFTSSRAIKSLLAVASSVLLLGSYTARADALHVSAASSTSNNVFDLTFDQISHGGSAAPLGITPLAASPKSSVRSIVYLPNDGTGVLDLIAADFNGSRIVRYPDGAGSASNILPITIWAAPAAGPKNPEGLSVDSGGNLFVNRGDVGHPELWVFPRDPGQKIGVAFLSPVLMDNKSFGTGSSTRLLETLVVRGATAAGLTPGDLLVLVNDGRVLRYSAADIKNFINDRVPFGSTPTRVPATVVITKQCPVGHTPTGMAMWPADSSIAGFSDSSLLVATVGGSILRYQLTPTGSTPLHAFATGLGASLGKIKTFTRLSGQNVVPYAVFDQPLRSKILEFGSTPPPPPASPTGTGGCPDLKAVCNTPLATITTVSYPVGLAATDASVPSSACVTTDPNALGGCTLLGGGLQVSTTSGSPPNTNASLLAQSCTIVDTRVNNLGNCDGKQLKVSDFCPGYPDTVIPPYLCAVGPGNTMAVIKVQEKNPLTIAPSDLLVNVDVTAEALLGGQLPMCPGITSGWAPLAGEVANANAALDYSLHPVLDQFDELGSICDAPASRTPGHSLVLVGVKLDPSYLPGDGNEAQLVTLADNKFASLLTILNPEGSAPISSDAKTSLSQCVSKAQSYLHDTDNLSPSNRYACSARKIRECDSSLIVTTFGPNTNQLSAYSAVDGHLLNLFTHIYTRLGLQDAPASLPLPTPVPSSTCDDTPPDAPGTPVATNVTQISLTLTWQPAHSNGVAVAGYNVFRNGGTTPVGTVPAGTCATTCSFPDSGLTAGTPYQYTVQAYDTWNPPGKSLQSGTLNVTTASPPLELSSSYVPGDSTGRLLDLSWTPTTIPGATTYWLTMDGTQNTQVSGGYYRLTLPDPALHSFVVTAKNASTVLSTSNTLTKTCYDPDRLTDDTPGEEPDCDRVPLHP